MPNEVDIEKSVRIGRLFDYYGGLLSDRQREVISLHYDDDLSLGEIAQLSGITRQGVLDSMRKAENALISCEEKLGLLARADSIQARLNAIADKIEHTDSDDGYDCKKKIADELRAVQL